MKPFLSICIPTFNRGEIVYQTVKKCLEYKNPNIEVVVSDNCSEDNTAELLATITDKRFKYFKNDYNNGADNLISVLTYGSGEYLLLTSDEDTIVIENMDKIIGVLLEEKPAVLKAGATLFGKPYVTHRNGVYNAGFEAIRTYGVGCGYMSAYIYNKSIMDKVLDGIKGTNINRRFGYAYNFTNLAREMLEHGTLCFREEVITNQIAEGKRDEGTYFDGGKMCYDPEMRLKATKERIDSLKRVNLNEKQKYLLCEYYLNKDVIMSHVAEYKNTFDNDLLGEFKEKKSFIYNYYIKKREELLNGNVFSNIDKSVDEYIQYIDSIKIFKENYQTISEKYSDIRDEYRKKRIDELEKFRIEKQNIDSEYSLNVMRE